jgi:hypothetical protein
MDIEKHIRSYVLASSAIRAVIGTRFYPIKLPQNPTLPAMTLQRISGVRFPPLKGRASVARPRFQFDIWVRETANVPALNQLRGYGRLLLDWLEGKNIDVLDDEVSPAEYRNVSFEFITDDETFEPDVNGGFYRYRADFYIWHQTGHGRRL